MFEFRELRISFLKNISESLFSAVGVLYQNQVKALASTLEVADGNEQDQVVKEKPSAPWRSR